MIEVLINTLKAFKEAISFYERKEIKKEKLVSALKSIQIAIIETRIFIENVGYETNSDLSKLWLDAFEKSKQANIFSENDFLESLYYKARFWGNPKEWLNEPSSLELIPTLIQLENECNSILIKIK